MKNRRPIRLLVTGFGPFPGVSVNPTERMARRLGASRRFARLGIAISAHVFPTRWATVARELPLLLARVRPDAVLHLGVAARRRWLAIETVARPSPSIIAPDAGGQGASAQSSRGAAHSMRIAAPAQAILASLARAGAGGRLSNDAGRYLCNALYHQSLSLRAGARETRPTVFIHTPTPGRARSKIPVARVRTRKPSEQAMMRGLERALVALAIKARAIPPPVS